MAKQKKIKEVPPTEVVSENKQEIYSFVDLPFIEIFSVDTIECLQMSKFVSRKTTISE